MATGSSKVASPYTELGEDDLKLLYNTLYRIRKKYALLGMQIGLKKSEIDDIGAQKLDPSMSLLEVLSVRVKKAEALTWNDIYNALRSQCIDESKLAKEIWAKHLFIPESSTESESEQEHEIKSEEIERVKKRAPKKQKGGDHRAKVSKEQERSSEYEGTETVRSKKHVQEVESEDEEDAVLSRKEKKKKVRRKGAHYQYKEVHDKERPKGKNKKESQSEQEEVVREKSKRKKKATHDKEESVKGYGDRDHYSDTEVCEKVRKRSKKHSKKREVYTESESEASSDEDELENSSFEDDTSHKESARRKLTKHKEVKIHPQKEHRKEGKRKDAKSCDIQYSDEEVSAKSAQKSKKVETESEEESSFASSSDEEEIEVHKITKKSKRTETKSAARTKDTAHYESEEKGKASGKKRVSLKPKSATAEASHYPEEYKDKGRKKAVRVDEKVGKSTDFSRETYHKTRSKPPRKETEGRDGKREVVSGKKAKKVTAPPLERDLPSSEMAQTDSGDGESDESNEDKNESEQQSSDEEEETENGDHSTAEEKEEKGSRKSKERSTHPTTEMRKTKSQDDETSRGVKGKKLSKAAGAPSKDGSHGDKEESDAGGSRDQEDQPKKRNRRRHRESSKSPIVRGGSSPSSSQEERKPGSRGKKRNKRGREHKKKSDRKKRRKGDKDGASGIDDSSPECDMKNQSEVEMKELASVFEHFYGKLCCVEFNPRNIAAQLQEKALISIPVMNEMLLSPESQQAMIVSLIGALYEKIKSHPEHLFLCIEVMLKNDALQKAGKEMLSEAGKNTRFLCIEHCLSINFFISAKVCPALAAARFPSQVSPSDLAVVVSPDVVGMQTVTICVVTVVCLHRSTFILQRVRGRHKEECPAQPQKALHSLCLHPVQVQAMLHHLRQ